jgi:transposase-like protein
MTQFQPGNTRSAKLSNEEVLEMRRRYGEGQSQAQLARHYGVNVNTVGRIVRGESRQRVPMPVDPPDVIAARLAALQESHNQSIHERLTTAIQKEYTTQVKPIQELEEFLSPTAADKYGITKE